MFRAVCKISEIKAESTVADISMRSAMEPSRNRSATCLFALLIRLSTLVKLM